MNTTRKIVLWATATLTLMHCTQQKTDSEQEGYIGPSDIRIEDGHLSPEALLSLGRLSDPQLSPDGKWILYGVSYTDIAANRTCRNLFLSPADPAAMSVDSAVISSGSEKSPSKIQLTKAGKSLSNARWSKDGKAIFYLQGGQLYKAPFADARLGEARQLSNWENGISEFKLSPDESRILFTSSVPNDKLRQPKDFDPALDKAQAYVTEDLSYRHWDHWVLETPQAYVAPFGDGQLDTTAAVNILGDEAGKFQVPNEPFGGIEQLCWSPDGSKVAYSCKKTATGKEYAFSTDTEIYLYDIASRETVRIPMDGGYDTDPVWSPDGKHIAWLSMARNGYEADKTRLMVADFAPCEKGRKPECGGEIPHDSPVCNIRDLTAGFKYNAASPVWSGDSKQLYFNALVEGLQAIYKIDVQNVSGAHDDLPALPVRITPEDAWYDFNSPFAFRDGKLLASWCSMQFPNELVTVNEADGRFRPLTDENGHILKQLKPCRMEAQWLPTVDGKKMLTWIVYPPEFDEGALRREGGAAEDAGAKYPAVEILLGGPQGTLSQGWSYRWNYYLMASQGYVVVLPNRRGTTAFGQEWCEQISGDYIGLNMQDYLTAARYIKGQPYISKLAACGASYGGYSVYYMAGIHGDTYDCFIAHAGIFDEKYLYYETEEMWFPNWDNGGLTEYAYTPGEMGPRGDGRTFGGMQQAGSPWSNAPKAVRHYSNSPAANVTKWHTPILCIHGMKDYRIPYDQGMAAFNTARMMGVPSKLIVFPEENHWILQPQNALFWHREYFDWLDRWCK